MTDHTHMPNDIHALKAEARRLSRQGDGPSYCQALDALARTAGHPHWKSLLRSSSSHRPSDDIVRSSLDGAPVVSHEAARRTSDKLNAWVSRAMQAGTAPDPQAMRLVTSDASSTFVERVALARRCFGNIASASDEAFEAAVLITAGIAHDALTIGDVSHMPWRRNADDLKAEDLVRAVECMWSAGPPAGIDDANGDAAHDERTARSTAIWFARMADVARGRGRGDMSELLARMSRGPHEERVSVVQTMRPLRLLCEPERTVFERMLAERYSARTSMEPGDHAEDARATLDVHLEDLGLPFGHPSVDWDRDLANQLADDDLEHWSD